MAASGPAKAAFAFGRRQAAQAAIALGALAIGAVVAQSTLAEAMRETHPTRASALAPGNARVAIDGALALLAGGAERATRRSGRGFGKRWTVIRPSRPRSNSKRSTARAGVISPALRTSTVCPTGSADAASQRACGWSRTRWSVAMPAARWVRWS